MVLIGAASRDARPRKANAIRALEREEFSIFLDRREPHGGVFVADALSPPSLGCGNVENGYVETRGSTLESAEGGSTRGCYWLRS